MRGKEVDIGILILRIAVGFILLYYGCQKMLGIFGGHGFTQQIADFQKMGFPPLFGTLSIFAEFFGSLGLIFGALTRVAAFGVFCNMCVATYMGVRAPGLFQNVFTYGQSSDARALFYPALICLPALTLVFLGGGKYSIDSRLFGRGRSGPKKG